MSQDSKSGVAIIISVSVIVLIIFSAADVLDPAGIAIADGIADFFSSLMERFAHEEERQIVENPLIRAV